MKVKLTIIAFIFAISNLYSIELHVSDWVNPGDCVTLFIEVEDGIVKKSSIKLLSADGTLISMSEGFDYSLSASINGQIAFIPIPMATVEQTAYIEAYVETTRATSTIRKAIGIENREFTTETLELTRTLTSIRTEPDPRKAEQSRLLWSVMNEFEVESQYSPNTLILPIEDEWIESSSFGLVREYIYDDGSNAYSRHSGVDMAAPLGTELVAVGFGKIVLAEEFIVTGKTVVLEIMPGLYSLYYHLDEIDVQVGDMINRGDRIGTVGMTGLATGAHLHWEMRCMAVPVDPYYFISNKVIDKSKIMDIINDYTLERGGD